MLVMVMGISLYNQSGKSYQSPNYTEPVTQSVISPIHKRIKGISANKNEREQEQKEKGFFEIADHKAQIRMSTYALYGILLGILGSYLLLRTLLYTRDAATAANQTLGVARNTLTETKSNSRRELRAYLAIHIVAKNINETSGVPTIYIRFHNRGISPAMDIRLRILEGMGQTKQSRKEPLFNPTILKKLNGPLKTLIWRMKEGKNILESESNILTSMVGIDGFKLISL